MNRKVILAGGSGFLGMTLAARLERVGYEPVILSRKPSLYPGRGRAVHWDGTTAGEWIGELEGARAIVNLTGKNVNCRPTERNRKEILTSRVDSVRVLGEALRRVNEIPDVWVQSGSLAIYGNAGDRVCDESARVADGYPADVCVAWESELGRALRTEMRWVNLRIGFVLGRSGGALPLLARLARLGLGGPIGDGRQFISWIHLEDMLRILLRSIDDAAMTGTYNATGPHPVRNREFMGTLRRVLHRPWSPPAPAWAVGLGAPLIGSDPGIALTGRRGIPARLEGEGFSFTHPDLESALHELFDTKPS